MTSPARVVRNFDLAPLKRYILNNFPHDHPLQIIQEEPDKISDSTEFLAKMELLLRLARI
jgi:hypothetical protein